jgi:uncharacterized protein (DUF1697 family)
MAMAAGRSVAFLRAINVGGRTVRMEELRAVFRALGLDSVDTFIASGNVLFDAAGGDPQALERRIEAELSRSLGYAVATFIRSPGELDAILRQRPRTDWDAAAGQSLNVGFLHTQPEPTAVDRLQQFAGTVDAFEVIGREVYWLRRGGPGASTFSGARLERALGMPATLRSITTVTKVAARAAGGG